MKLIIMNLIENRNSIINTIKLLIYKENLSLFDELDFENDEVYLNPLLFAYFNYKRDNFLPVGMLNEIINRVKNDNTLTIDVFEIQKEIHVLQKHYFRETYKGHIVNGEPTFNSVCDDCFKNLEKAIFIIKKQLPEFYNELCFANRQIYLHDNSKILNFTTFETLGSLYFYVIDDCKLVYFIEELIHQGSHNFLYYVLHNRKEYFKIDVDNLIMRDYTKQKWDYRSIYGAYHGLYTVTKRLECFDILLSKNIFSGKEKHELLGRLADMFPRFKTGLELLNLDKVYTEKGMKFYFELTRKSEDILKKYKKLVNEFDLSHRDLDFRYNEFCLTNSFEVFQNKDLEGYYNF